MRGLVISSNERLDRIQIVEPHDRGEFHLILEIAAHHVDESKFKDAPCFDPGDDGPVRQCSVIKNHGVFGYHN